jgi:hypothetical protein
MAQRLNQQLAGMRVNINDLLTCLTRSYKILDKAYNENFISIGLDQILCQQSR